MKIDGYICGWASLCLSDSETVNQIKNMTSRFSLPHINEYKNKNNCLLTNSDLDSSEDISAVISGLPVWNSTDMAKHAVKYGDVSALIKAYKRYGEDVLKELKGRFSLALIDSSNNIVMLAIDRIGQQHLYYSEVKNGLVFSSRADAVASHTAVSSSINPQGIFNYLYFHSVPSPSSIYKGINKLENGQCLIYKSRKLTIENYWKPGFQETLNASLSDVKREMLEVAGRAVKRCSDGVKSGAFLSGGLDSSTVAGLLAKNTQGKTKTFTIGFDVEGYDETEYARIASENFKTQPHEYYVTPSNVLDMVPKIAAYYDEPFGNSSALPAYFCAKLAKENGVDRLLAGDGGDEIFAGNERYVKQAVFEHYQSIPNFIRKGIIESVLAMPKINTLPGMKKITSYVSQANIPLPDRLEVYNFLHQHAANQIFSNSILDNVNIHEPIDILRRVYQAPNEASTLNRMLYMDWKRTLHDNDLVKVNHMCQMAGVEVAYPLLDDELVDFSCQIPSYMKVKRNHLRWFFKESVKGFLPDAIINKSKHGFGLPFGVWTSTDKNLQALAYDSLTSLKKRDIFLPTFIDETIRMHQSVHAKYYGELVWILMMLELWLSNNKVKLN